MQVDETLWLFDGYYVDIDELGQLRIVGPQNHLYFGSVGLANDQFSVDSASVVLHELHLGLTIKPSDDFIADPAIGHIRHIRQFIQVIGEPTRSFERIAREHPGVIAPTTITAETTKEHSTIRYTRAYGDHFYGVTCTFEAGVGLHRDDSRRGFRITRDTTKPLTVKIVTDSDDLPDTYQGTIFTPASEYVERHSLTPPLDRLWERTTVEIEHLIRGRKTSGFDYGTVFPRDWMEAADLIAGELTDETYRFMYTESLRHVNEQGAGWHEDIIGEFAYERRQEIDRLSSGFDMFVDPGHPSSPQFRKVLEQLDELFVTRMMIDIEPHYILGLRRLEFDQFSEADQIRLRHVAHFIIRRATRDPLITFNKLALPFKRHRGDEYYLAGNWRDSLMAYQRVGPVIAPYDVNAVFYPEALKIIATNAKALMVNETTASELAETWSNKADLFRFEDAQGRTAMALALYGDVGTRELSDFSQLRVSHLDEAYACAYGSPDRLDVIGFAERLASPDYFYTPSGPTVVARGQGYDHSQYHGEVIWTKQTAFVIIGLERQLRRAEREGWSASDRQKLAYVIELTARTSVAAFTALSSIPELHFDDAGAATRYSDQPHPEGQVNTVQLWSAAGARPVMLAAEATSEQMAPVIRHARAKAKPAM